MFLLMSVVVYLSLSYTAALFVASRRRRAIPMPAPDDLLFVFVMPCLNEERVIAKSLERLLAMPGNFAVLVVDDGSEDTTGAIVRASADARVRLLRREPPDARQGKGRALNAAYRYLLGSDLLHGRRVEDVVVAVMDADGRLATNALTEVAPYFRDPKIGAVQIGVRMYNASSKLLTRMQDLEFITYTEIFQRARQRLGSVGLGGNGQFTRLAALQSLGDEPWSDCLTEDLDLGLRLLANGWDNAFCPTTRVSQQALAKIRPLIRQRTRWFQGHLQTWRRLPLILRSTLPLRTMLDLVNVIINPGLVLATSLLVPVLMSTLLVVIVTAPLGFAHALLSSWGINIFFWYLLTFGLAPFYGFAYWMQEESVSFPRAVVYAHVYSLYGYMWFVAGWRAVGRIVLRRSSWAKTARIGAVEPLGAQTGGGPGDETLVVDLRVDPVPVGLPVDDAADAAAADPPDAPGVEAPDAPEEVSADHPRPLPGRRMVFGAGVPLSVLALVAAAVLLALHADGSGSPVQRGAVRTSAPVPAGAAVPQVVAFKSGADNAALVSAAPDTAARSAAPATTTPDPTTTSTSRPTTTATPAPSPSGGPVTVAPSSRDTTATGPQATTTTTAPACPSGRLAWTAHSEDHQQGDRPTWRIDITGTISNQTTSAVHLDSVVVTVSYQRPDGSPATAQVTVNPGSASVGPSASTAFDGSTTLDSTNAPDITGVTIASHWANPADNSCPTPR